MEEREEHKKEAPLQGPYPYPYPYPYGDTEEDEIDLLEYWAVIWKNRRMISAVVAVVVAITTVYAIISPNIYCSKAVIMPIGAGKSVPSGLAQMASQFAGISLPGNPGKDEIQGLLNSNILKKDIIERYRLMPLLFPDSWDREKGEWKKPGKFGEIIHWFNPRFLLSQLVKLIHPPPESIKKHDKDGDLAPDIHDGIRKLTDMVKVSEDRKSGCITVSVEDRDPELAARLVGYILHSLRQHMSREAIRLARGNREYLTRQLKTTTDPIIRNKIYELIASQVERETLAGNTEGYAFKVIDPPMVPDKRIKPKRSLMVVLGAVVSTFLGIFLAFFMEYIKNARERLGNKDAGDKE